MRTKAKICKKVNSKFPLPKHPFNLNNDGIMTYSEWQYSKGIDTIKFYLEFSSAEEMFKNKIVLDIGCGAAGKTMYYASLGVNKIYGVEILSKYKNEAESLAKKLKLDDKFDFVSGDAANLPFESNSIDTIIMNDAMEHVDEPEKVLKECIRVLKVGGRLYLNFPPYHHPFGAHLSDAIGIPWVHLFFDDATLIEVYKDAVADLPDGKDRIEFRIAKKANGEEYFSYINGMTLKRFKRILNELGINPVYYREVPLRNVTKVLAHTPILKEMFVKMAVCVIEKKEKI